MSDKDICDEIISCLTDAEFLNRMMFNKIIDNMKLFYRDIIFTPHNILKNMDYSGGTLNYQGIELLRVIKRVFLAEE